MIQSYRTDVEHISCHDWNGHNACGIPFHLYDTYIVLRTVVCSFHHYTVDQRSLILPISGCRQQEIAKHTYSSQKYHAFVTRFNARTCGSITCESSSALPHLFSKSRAVRRHLLAATCKIQKGSWRLFPIAIISPIKYSFDKQNQRGGYKFWLEQSEGKWSATNRH